MSDLNIEKNLLALEEELDTHVSLRHHLLLNISASSISTEKYFYIIKGYVQYSKKFPTLLSSILSQWQDNIKVSEKVNQVFSEELSLNTNELSHSEQLNACADSSLLGFKTDVLVHYELAANTYADKIIKYSETDKFIALGIIGPGTEFIVPKIYDHFLKWFRKSNEKYDYSFFEEHAIVDIHHADLIRKAIYLSTTKSSDFEKIRTGANYALDMRNELWDTLLNI